MVLHVVHKVDKKGEIVEFSSASFGVGLGLVIGLVLVQGFSPCSLLLAWFCSEKVLAQSLVLAHKMSLSLSLACTNTAVCVSYTAV